MRKTLFLIVVFCLVLPLVATAQTVQVKDKFEVVVDYSQTLEEMITAGRYDSNRGITEEDFPISISKRGQEKVTVELVHFTRYLRIEEIFSELDNAGFRPAELPELLAFGFTYRERPGQYSIVALGSIAKDHHDRRWVVELSAKLDKECELAKLLNEDCKPQRRGLFIQRFDQLELLGWQIEGYLFAAVRINSPKAVKTGKEVNSSSLFVSREYEAEADLPRDPLVLWHVLEGYAAERYVSGR